jgi:GNAT superfamily N-acetyltransferase
MCFSKHSFLYTTSAIAMQPRILFEPTLEHLNQLHTWLKEEYETQGEGFFCNWRIIETSFEAGELFCIATGESVVGFLVWTKRDRQVRLDICEVHPEYRRMGLAHNLVESSLMKFAGEGVLVAELECQPPTSEPIWRQMGFIDFPGQLRDPYLNAGIELYRPLQPAARANTRTTCEEVLELWSCEPWDTENKAPTWTWEIVREQGSTRLADPIIFPCSREWKLRWRRGETTLAEKKVKYFLPGSLDSTYLMYTHLDVTPPPSSK